MVIIKRDGKKSAGKKIWKKFQDLYGRHGGHKQPICKHLEPTMKIGRRLGKGFYMMDEQGINTIREDLMQDFYVLAQTHANKNPKIGGPAEQGTDTREQSKSNGAGEEQPKPFPWTM